MRVLLLVLLLSACTYGAASGTDRHTGLSYRYSSKAMIDATFGSRLQVQAVHLRKGDVTQYELQTYVTRSDLNYPRIESVWSFGHELPYIRVDRRRYGYERQEVGAILLPEPAIRAAAAGPGLSFRMIGRRSSYEGHVPARLFREVLDGAGPK
ncbi:MAG: hypothetical protein QNJ13_05125 [Paracoccaceae bacterium]|nr:hypothetical protein [Paracoccaceae bacterium]